MVRADERCCGILRSRHENHSTFMVLVAVAICSRRAELCLLLLFLRRDKFHAGHGSLLQDSRGLVVPAQTIILQAEIIRAG